MAIIDKLYRNKLLAQTPSWVKEMSDEELNQTISQMESQNSQAQKQGIASSIGDLGNIFLQKGGLRPMPRAENNENNINEFIQKKLIEQQIAENDPIRIAQMEARKKYAQVYGGGIGSDSEIVPVESVNPSQTPVSSFSAKDSSATPVQASQPGNDDNDYFYKPIYKNIGGIPTAVAYEKKLTEEGKLKKKQEFESQKKYNQLKVEAESDINQVKGMLDAAWKTADELIPAPEKQREALAAGMSRTAGTFQIAGQIPAQAFGMSDENALAYKSFLDGTVSMIIRGLGEKGVLNNQDIKRAYNLMPNFNDTKKVRITKKEQLNNFLTSKVNSFYKTKSGTILPQNTTQGNYDQAQEKLIQENMAAHGKSREEVIGALKQKGYLQ